MDKNNIKFKFVGAFTFALIYSFSLGSKALSSDVVASGTTATIINESSGHYNVSIAPKNNSGTSFNQYNKFNVPLGGVDLDNRYVGANLIINEVVQPNPTMIRGELSVLGNMAHVAIVNPWGITVDGGKFINFAGLVLATSGNITNGFSSGVSTVPNNNGGSDVKLNTSVGEILIGEGGLSGAFTNVEMIARKITVNGNVENGGQDQNSRTHLVAGESETIIKSDHSVDTPSDLFADSYSVGGSPSSKEILIDITGIGSLSDSRINIVANSLGAGVNSRGNIEAKHGEILLSAADDIQITGGVVFGNNRVSLNAKKNIVVKDALVASSANVFLNSDEADITNISASVSSSGDLLISAPNGLVSNIIEKEQIPNQGKVIQYGGKVGSSFFRKKILRGYKVDYGNALLPNNEAAFSAAGDVNIESLNLSNVGGNIISGGDINLTIGNSAINNSGNVVLAAQPTGSAWFETKCAWFCDRSGGSNVTLLGGIIAADEDININANKLSNEGAVLVAENDLNISGLSGGKIDEVSVKSYEMYNYLNFDRGLRGDYGYMIRFDQGGALIANKGKIQIASLKPLSLTGGEIIANETIIENGVITIRPKNSASNVTGLNIGLFGGIF